jgi:hypothetical protein
MAEEQRVVGYQGMSSVIKFKNICTSVLRKEIGDELQYQRQNTFLPEQRGERGFKTVSQGNATRVA